MTAVERIKTAVNFEEPDRVPVYIMGIPPYSKVYKEFWAKEDEIFGDGGWGDNDDNIILTPMGDFTIKYFFGADVDMSGIGVIFNFKTKILLEDGTIKDDEGEIAKLKPGESIKTVNYFGMVERVEIFEDGNRYEWYLDGYLKKKEDILNWYDTYGWLADKKVNKARAREYEQTVKEFGDRFYLIPQIAGVQLYESLWPIMGQARFGYYCRKDPDLIRKLINDRKEAQLHILDELKKYKPFVVFGGDDMGQKGRPLISPIIYRKFFKEPYREIFTKVHEELGAKIFNHSCGNIEELLPDMIEAGLDGWQSLEPASLIDHAAVKKKYPNFILCGGIDSREISFGTRDSIRKHVKEQIDKMAKGGGYIAGPTHDFLVETPMENVLHMRDAIYEFGRYKK